MSPGALIGRDHLAGERDKRVSRSQCLVEESCGGGFLVVRQGPNPSFYEDVNGCHALERNQGYVFHGSVRLWLGCQAGVPQHSVWLKLEQQAATVAVVRPVTQAAAVAHLEMTDDGGRSSNDFITRPISANIHANVYQANRTGAIAALAAWPLRGRVLNLCNDKIEDPAGRVDNELAIEDSAAMQVGDAARFLRATADRIETLAREAEWVVVNCQAGVNRSSGALLAWLLRHRTTRLGPATAALKAKKLKAATRLRFKNRFQSFAIGHRTERAFSWPTLAGRSAPVLERALAEMEARVRTR